MAQARISVLGEVTRRIPAPAPGSWGVRVAVDGVDGAGKTTFADGLAALLIAAGRPTVRASVDGFHHVRARRYRRGRTSWQGFWLDSFDYQQLQADLLDAFGPGRLGTLPTRMSRPQDRSTPGFAVVASLRRCGVDPRRLVLAPGRARRRLGLLDLPRRRLRGQHGPDGGSRRQ